MGREARGHGALKFFGLEESSPRSSIAAKFHRREVPKLATTKLKPAPKCGFLFSYNCAGALLLFWRWRSLRFQQASRRFQKASRHFQQAPHRFQQAPLHFRTRFLAFVRASLLFRTRFRAFVRASLQFWAFLLVPPRSGVGGTSIFSHF